MCNYIPQIDLSESTHATKGNQQTTAEMQRVDLLHYLPNSVGCKRHMGTRAPFISAHPSAQYEEGWGWLPACLTMQKALGMSVRVHYLTTGFLLLKRGSLRLQCKMLPKVRIRPPSS